MSFQKTIAKNKNYANKCEKAKLEVWTQGVDLLIVSPELGDPEPLYQMLKKDQLNGDSAKVYLKFTKETKMPGESGGWAWSFDGLNKWHQIDNFGTV